MKLLNNEEQTELQALVEEAAEREGNIDLKGALTYWALKLKRQRKPRGLVIKNGYGEVEKGLDNVA